MGSPDCLAKKNFGFFFGGFSLLLVFFLFGCNQTPTYYANVEPILQQKCNSCHSSGGLGGIPFNDQTAPALASLISQKVVSRQMPPWSAGPNSLPFTNSRALSQEDIDTVQAWAEAGAPLGDVRHHQERPLVDTFQSSRPADFQAFIPATQAYGPYRRPTDPREETRCFVLDPAFTQNKWITQFRILTDQPAAIHHINASLTDSNTAAKAKALHGKDGRAGYDCNTVDLNKGVFFDSIGGTAGGGLIGTGIAFPTGAGIFVPQGASLILEVHYVLSRLERPDRSGVALWYASDAERRSLRPMSTLWVEAPVAIPCPSGLSHDPKNACSVEYSLSHTDPLNEATIRSDNNRRLAQCGLTMDQYLQTLQFPTNPTEMSHFLVPTSCSAPLGRNGFLTTARIHMHTLAVQGSLEISKPDGSWTTILDIPHWNYHNEDIYVLKNPLHFQSGQKLRLHCTYDNGTANQWSALTDEPGTPDYPVPPPLQDPRFVVWGPRKKDEMCVANVNIQLAPYQEATYPTLCDEAQASYHDVCRNDLFTQGTCANLNERAALLWLRNPVPERCALFQNNPGGP